MVTHDRSEAYNMSREIAVMDAGAILTQKPTKALFSDPGSTQAAILTGCKNVVPARRLDAHTVEVSAWGVTLETKQEVRDGLTAIGIRAHYFSTATQKNRFPVQYTEEMEEPFEMILQFRWAGQREDSAPVWWRLPKDRRPAVFPQELGIAPANILLLYD